MVRMFKDLSSLKQHGYDAMTGAKTNDDARFLRVIWEVSPSLIGITRSETVDDRSWVRITRGGPSSPYYYDMDSVIDWADDGRCIKAFISDYRGNKGWGFQWSANLNGHDWYFRPGLTWPLRGVRLCVWPVPAGCLPSGAGKMAYAPIEQLPALLALANSQAFDAIVRLFAGKVGGVQYEAGLLQKVLLPNLSSHDRDRLGRYATRAWALKRTLDTGTETSHAFAVPALQQVEGDSLDRRAATWTQHVSQIHTDVAVIQREVDEFCFALYGIAGSDRRVIAESIGERTGAKPAHPNHADEAGDDLGEDFIVGPSPGALVLVAELVSWAVGVAFGRFDVRLATGESTLPVEPGPFDPLPACSPGMLTGDDGLPPASAPAGYPLAFPEDGMLVDDPGHPRDLTAAVRAAFEVVFGVSADAFWDEAAALLDPNGQSMRAWLAGDFFGHHLKRYSKSRRKAPIWWQLGVPSGRYSVWLYAHRLTRDSLFQLQNDVVAPKLVHEERRLTSMIQSSGDSRSAKERNEIARQETFVEELRTLLEEVKRVAPLWRPTLDDGVVLTMAPLWPLVSQHKPWQRELKSKWDELVAGKYDWPQIAMRLWPERVVPKCATDRSLAIAHGLEDIFWVEGDDGKWQHRAAPTQSVEDLITNRSSTTVQAALEASLDRPARAGSRRRAAPAQRQG